MTYYAKVADLGHELHKVADYYEGITGFSIRTLHRIAYDLQDIAAASRTHCPHCAVELEADKDAKPLKHCPKCHSSFMTKAIRP